MENRTDILLLGYKEYGRYEIPECPGIYCAYNVINKKIYIGQSSKMKSRISNHFYSSKEASSIYFHNALRKYGEINFKFFVLESFDKIDRDLLNKSEIYFIDKFDSTNSEVGYNLVGGGGGHKGVSITEEQKKAIAECNGKYTIGYNFVKKEYLEAYSREEMCKKLVNNGYDITPVNIRDAIRHKSFTKDFLFANSIEDLNILIKNFNIPIRGIWLYNFRTNGPKLYFNTASEAQKYIRNQGYNICSGHIWSAITKNNKYIKDFLIASSESELNQRIDEYSPVIYFYNIEKQFIITFPNIARAVETLKSMGFSVNSSSFGKAKNNYQKQACGFIIANKKEELIKKICEYTNQELDHIYKIIEESNLKDSQDCLNWLDSINEISVRN